MNKIKSQREGVRLQQLHFVSSLDVESAAHRVYALQRRGYNITAEYVTPDEQGFALTGIYDDIASHARIRLVRWNVSQTRVMCQLEASTGRLVKTRPGGILGVLGIIAEALVFRPQTRYEQTAFAYLPKVRRNEERTLDAILHTFGAAGEVYGLET